MPADDRLWAENCNRAEDGREPTIEPNKQKLIVLLSCGRLDTCRRSTMSCWRRIRISVTSFVLGLKSEAMIWRISRSNSIIKWQGYRVSASRLAESNFRYAQGDLSLNADVPLWDQCFAQLEPLQAAHDLQSEMPAMYGSLIKCRGLRMMPKGTPTRRQRRR